MEGFPIRKLCRSIVTGWAGLGSNPTCEKDVPVYMQRW